MPPFSRRAWCLALGTALLLVACAPATPSAGTTGRRGAGDIEALLVGDDSTTWIRVQDDSVSVARAPIYLALLDDRLVELMIAEDAVTFDAAAFVTERLYRRDLETGDSTLLYTDSVVTREAERWMTAHPEAEPRGPDDEGPESDRSLESTVTPLALIGPTLGVEVHRDRLAGEYGTHDTFRTAIDLRSGQRLSLDAIVGTPAAGRAQARADSQRTAAVAVAARRGGPAGAAASRALAALTLDPTSFALARAGDSLAVEFLMHAEQVIDDARDTHRFALEPLPLPSPAWWPRARGTLPDTSSDGLVTFAADSLRLAAQYDSTGSARIAATGGSRRMMVTRITGPIRHVIWLHPLAPPRRLALRRALLRAFDDARYTTPQFRAASVRQAVRPIRSRQAVSWHSETVPAPRPVHVPWRCSRVTMRRR